MSASVPSYAPCDGGLILNSNKFDLLRSPGVALRLRNYEVVLSGGYRRINGYQKFGTTSATRPNGDTPILGVHPYALGVVVVAGANVYYTEDGITWIQVNKDTTESGDVEANLSGLSTLTRANPGQTQFALVKGEVDHATNPYGTLYIASGNDPLIHFHIDGTGPSRTFHYVEVSGITGATYIESHDHHLCVVDYSNNPNLVYFSDIDNFDEFTGGTSGSVRLTDQIVGIKSFRDQLYIFCENSIHRLVNINDPANLAVLPVTGNLGCVTGYSIQEIGGDLIFLAPDGFRSVAATERNDDIERSAVSRGVQPIIDAMINNQASYTFSSVVLREKNQYRFFYINSAGVANGFIGTLKSNQNGISNFQWSEIRGMNVYSIDSYFNQNGVEVTYHGSSDGYVYQHDTGNSFDGSSIEHEFETPDTDFGDLGLRKTMHYLNIALDNEGIVDLLLTTYFDFKDSNTTQPTPFNISVASAPAKYGQATYGNAKYGRVGEPLLRIPLQGSGSSVAYKFYGNDTNPPFTIQGFHTEVFPSGRK